VYPISRESLIAFLETDVELSEYAEYDALGIANLIRKKEIKPDEVIETCHRAIEKVNPKINAVIGTIDPVNENFETNPNAPLFGVPFLLKDLNHGYAGVQCDMGSRLAQGYVFKNDSDLAKRFKSSGLVAVGRSNTPEFGLSGTTETILHGASRNPWNTELTTGGSSGGAAAAVAAGIVPVAHASDGGGSIRIPAAWTGLIGHKPSRGLIPKGPMSSDGTNWLSVHFVVSKTVRDTAAMMDALVGPALGDYIHVPKPATSFLRRMQTEPRGLRIALCAELDDGPSTHPDCRAAVQSAARLCEQLGHVVKEAKPAISCIKTFRVGYNLFLPGLVKLIDKLSRVMGRAIGPGTLEAISLAAYESEKTIQKEKFLSDLEEVNTLSRVMGEFMADYDILLQPAVTCPPFEVGVKNPNRELPTGFDYWAEEIEYFTTSPLFNITGQPTMSLPLFWNDDLPLGVQFTASIGNDVLLFQLAHQLEQISPWFYKRPSVHVAR